MHHLHTTSAFVLGTIPNRESSFTYRLFTRKFGLLYAHAQGVRELKSRNRYALQIGALPTVTLVRGRETWRLTGAEEGLDSTMGTIQGRKILDLLGKLLAVEDPMPEVFDLVRAGLGGFEAYPASFASTIETVTVLRILQKLGYVAAPLSESAVVEQILGSVDLSHNMLEQAEEQQQVLVGTINSALREANP